MRLLPIAVAALIVGPLWGQNPITISGRITDASNGLPIEDASVALAGGTDSSGQIRFTDAGGSYSFEPVAPGSGTVKVEAKGFLPFQKSNSDQASIRIDANHGAYNFSLTPAASIAGTITGDDSLPDLGAWLLQEDFTDGVRHFSPAWNKPGTASPVGKDGSFQFTGLAPGRYIIGAGTRANVFFIQRDATGKPALAKNAAEGYAPTYFPGTTDFSAAVPISLSAGETRRADFKVRKQHLFQASGELVLPEADLHYGVARIVPLDEGIGGDPYTASLSDSGHFAAEGLPPGRYQVKNVLLRGNEVNENGRTVAFQMMTLESSLIFSITDHDLAGLKIVQTAAMPADGVVGVFRTATSSARPPTGLAVQFAYSEPGGESTAIPASDDGVFWLTGPPGDYSVRPIVPAAWAVTEIRYSGGNYLNSRIPMSGGVANPSITIVLSDQPGAVSGSLVDKDQKPLAANVSLIPDPVPADLDFRAIRVAKTDENGIFVFRGLAPGRYKAVALTGDDRRQDHDMALIEPRLGLADSFEVTAGQTLGINLK